ncbi:hypothetical protein J6590_102155 [Homalodisca vitripennis]|nr:hypothetical protein J6590_102155 [Homalodisca vitripennis]
MKYFLTSNKTIWDNALVCVENMCNNPFFIRVCKQTAKVLMMALLSNRGVDPKLDFHNLRRMFSTHTRLQDDVWYFWDSCLMPVILLHRNLNN